MDVLLLDIMFYVEVWVGYDVVICYYYDQGLIFVKMLDFYGGVNMILGLFIICILLDYGMVFDIVGQGIVWFESLIVVF